MLVFFHGNNRIFHIPLDDGHMMTVKTIGAGHAARWLRRFMLMPPNAEDEKNGRLLRSGHHSWFYVLMKGSMFFEGGMFMEPA